MNATEFATLASAIKAAYPAANIMPDKQSKEVWYTMLRDLDYTAALNAVKAHISTNKFAPSIAELREKCLEMSIPEIPDWSEGWEEVEMAIRKYGTPRADLAVKEMSDLTRKCVRRLGFVNICLTENLSVERANFRMIYEAEAKRVRQDHQMPPALKEIKKNLIEQKAGEITKEGE
ncbi:replicative helicase loader/inhibitor [Diplocloster modestus]|uniref:Replicative helicase inhibitor G39P N-terminal domain-containing protein n=1 Tax=Diplocloster modestus TaxID=2850322 RepID=A0ABS6K0P2_9FIRM|nr:replicative helicase loader/inhibitor [Diplocloster modestus]MBU9724412.1 hypothetical protein [Diplocloster modestus]